MKCAMCDVEMDRGYAAVITKGGISSFNKDGVLSDIEVDEIKDICEDCCNEVAPQVILEYVGNNMGTDSKGMNS